MKYSAILLVALVSTCSAVRFQSVAQPPDSPHISDPILDSSTPSDLTAYARDAKNSHLKEYLVPDDLKINDKQLHAFDDSRNIKDYDKGHYYD